MPLKLYKRDKTYWFKGRIDELPDSKYYRQSTHKSSKASAIAVRNHFQQTEVRRFYSGDEAIITFSEAVLHYRAKPEFAKALIPIVKVIGEIEVSKITPKFVRNLGYELQPDNATDTWQKRIVTPIRAVINNAHELGLCAPLKVKTYSKAERLEQDRKRKKTSRIEKTPGSWPWIIAFRETAPKHVGALALFMFETGARISQATSIRFNDLDVSGEKILMPEAKGVEEKWVALSPELTIELSELVPRYTRRKVGGKILSDRLFGYQRRDGLYATWKRVCKNAGIDIIMPHAAGRHGFGTEMMVRQGIDPVTVAKVGRWADAQMLMKTYAHPDGADDKIQTAIRTGRVQAESRRKLNTLKGNNNE